MRESDATANAAVGSPSLPFNWLLPDLNRLFPSRFAKSQFAFSALHSFDPRFHRSRIPTNSFPNLEFRSCPRRWRWCRRGRDRRTGKKVALKCIGHPDRRTLAMEAGCLHACRGHPSIIGIQDVATDPKTGEVHLVLELVHGGSSLRDSMWRPLSEDVVRVMMRQLVSAAKKIHGEGIIHRDMKPENVLVCPFGDLKVCDFGSATRQKPAGKAHEAYSVGTLQYNAPELLDRNWYYGPAVDMWGLGCVMAELLTGDTLFEAETGSEMRDEMSELRSRMTSAVGKLDPECLADLSADGRDVLTGLLGFCPVKRLTASEALEHPWFKNFKSPWIYDIV